MSSQPSSSARSPLLAHLCLASALALALVAIFGAHSAGAADHGTPSTTASSPGRELVELRTARSRTWARPDGTRLTRVYERPVHVREAGDTWRPVDATLRRAGDRWVNGPAPVDLSLPTSLDAGPVALTRGDRRLALRLRGDDTSAAVDGPVATYRDVAPGVTARWTSQVSGVKEELVLDHADVATSFTYDVTLSEGLRLVDQPDGGIFAVGPNGQPHFVLEAPFADDAAGRRAPRAAVQMAAQRSGEDWTIRLSVDRAWLDAPARRFPVVVDPTVEAPPVSDCYIDAATPDTPHCGESGVYVGPLRGQPRVGLLHFDLTDVLPPEANILRAAVSARGLLDYAVRSTEVDIFNVTSAWTDVASWNRRTPTEAWTTPGGDLGVEPLDSTTLAANGTAWYVTELVRGWFDGSTPNHGVALRQAASSPGEGVGIVSSDVPDVDRWPSLEIVYAHRTGTMGDYTIDTQPITDRQTLGVNVAGGNLLLSARDLEIGGRGLDLAIGRAYNSQSDLHGQTGRGSTLSIGSDVRLSWCDRRGSRCYEGPTGIRARFAHNADGSFATPPGLNATLVRESDSTFTLTFNRTGVRYRFGRNGLLTDMVDRNGNTIHFDYTTTSQLSLITDTQGRQVQVTRDAMGNVTEFRDPSGRAWDYYYDARGKLETARSGNGYVKYAYDAQNRVNLVTDARNTEIHIGYDFQGRVASVRRRMDDTGRNDLVTTYTYAGPTAPCVAGSDVGKTIVVDARGRDTTYCWNVHGRVTRTRDALGRDVSRTYTPNGDAADFTRFAGTDGSALWSLSYDANDNVTGSTAPMGERQAIEYWSATSNPSDPLRRYRPQSYTDEQGQDQFYGYDDAGNLTDVKDDATNPLNQATLAYNADGTLRSATDGNGNTTTFGYDAIGNLASVDPAGSILPTTYAHDAVGRVRTVTDGRGERLEIEYNHADRLTEVRDTASRPFFYFYDGNGNAIERSTVNNTTSRYTYDRANRLVREDRFGEPGYATYAYDKAGNLTSVTDKSGTVRYTYDDVNRVRTIVSARPGGGTDTVTVSHADPSATDPTSVRTLALPSGATQRTVRDLSGKPIDIALRSSTGDVLVRRLYEYAQGADQRVVVQGFEDETGGGTLYRYDGTGRLVGADSFDGVGNPGAARSYAYDNAGNLTRNDDLAFAFNDANELCWRFDDAALAGPSHDCDTPPDSPSADPLAYAYDDAGSQTAGENRFVWDRFGRLSNIDGGMLFYRSMTNDQIESITVGGGSRHLDHNVLGLSRVDTPTEDTSIVRDPDTGMAISQSNGTDKRWHLQDNIGSTIALSDGSGAVARTYAYEPYGGLAGRAGTGPESVLQFVGGVPITSTGTPWTTRVGQLYHFGARFYSTDTGRWTSLDPLHAYADLQQANRFTYVGGDPINRIDPSGRGIGDTLKDGFKKVAKPFTAVGGTCYVYEASKDDEDDVGDEWGDLSDCSNPGDFITDDLGITDTNE